MTRLEIRNFPELAYMGKEAINTLCTNLSFTGGDIKTIMITSCNPGEGKSFISMNLMRSFAELGYHVLLLDADIRASMLMSTYSIKVEETGYEGLTGYLAGRVPVEKIICTTNIENADIALSGKLVANSLPLLKSPRLSELLKQVKQTYDIVIIDAPPIGTIIDAAQIAANCDGTVLIAECKMTKKQQIKDALEQIARTGCPILGTVLNKFKYNVKKNSYYDKYYGENKLNGQKSKRN